MPREAADKTTPPPLRAIGGWLEADWFEPSILQEGEVVGFSLPALAGSRKQNFELAERSLRRADAPKRAAKRGAAVPARVPSGIGQILDDLGSLQAASFRRPRFFFEAAPSLFFAVVPTTHLKLRACETLRRNLIVNALRGCILAFRPDEVTALFWPSLEADVTGFIRAAAPPHAMHAQFDQAEEERRVVEAVRRRGHDRPPAGRQAGAGEQAERERLLAELDGMRARVAELQRLHSAEGALETLGLTDARLKAMLLLLHPDKHGNSEAANEAAKWVNGLREVLKASASKKA